MTRAAFASELLAGVQELMAELGETIEIGEYQAGQDPVTGDLIDPIFLPVAAPLGVLMPLTEEQRAQLLPTSGAVPEKIPTYVAYLPPFGQRFTPDLKLRLRDHVYDPVTEPTDIGGMGVAWEVYLRRSV